MIDPRLPCGQCQACKGGRDYGCPKQGGIGYNFGGGLAQRVAVPEQNLYHLPATIPLEFAALIEPFTVATHAIAKTGIVDWTNQLVLIIGGGPVGFALMLALRAHQPRTIIVSEPTSTRRAQVANMADVTLDPLRQNVAEACREASPAGVDVVFDCAGTAAGMADGLDALRCEGTYMTVALYQQPVSTLDPERSSVNANVGRRDGVDRPPTLVQAHHHQVCCRVQRKRHERNHSPLCRR